MTDISEDVLASMGVSEEDLNELSDSGDIDISLAKSVDAAIERHIQGDDGESDRHKFRPGVYHASGAAKCIRKRWYSALNVVKEEWREFPAGIAHRGNVVEDEVEAALTDHLHDSLVDEMADELRDELSQHLFVGNEYPVSEEIEFGGTSFWVTGSTDPYVEDGEGNLLEVIEVKSANDPPDEPNWYNLWQLNTYLSILGLKRGTIVYIDPSNWDNREVFEYEQDPELWELIKLYHGVFHLYIEADELPPRLPVAENECEHCAYRGLCQRNDDGKRYTEEAFPPEYSTDRYNWFLDTDRERPVHGE